MTDLATIAAVVKQAGAELPADALPAFVAELEGAKATVWVRIGQTAIPRVKRRCEMIDARPPPH